MGQRDARAAAFQGSRLQTPGSHRGGNWTGDWAADACAVGPSRVFSWTETGENRRLFLLGRWGALLGCPPTQLLVCPLSQRGPGPGGQRCPQDSTVRCGAAPSNARAPPPEAQVSPGTRTQACAPLTSDVYPPQMPAYEELPQSEPACGRLPPRSAVLCIRCCLRGWFMTPSDLPWAPRTPSYLCVLPAAL